MQTTIYIRKENEEFWNSLGKDKSKWVNEQIGRGEDTPATPAEPIYETVAPVASPAPLEAPKLKVLTNDDLKTLLASSDRKPIEATPTHVCKDNCKHWVWDADRGGRVNTLTGEFQEGSPW